MIDKNEIQEIDAETIELFARAKIEWRQNKESIFRDNFEGIMGQPQAKVVSFSRTIIRLVIAASLLIVVSLTLASVFYTKTIYCPAGRHLTAQLPDGSRVEMNAETRLKYYPWRWYFQRKLELDGEAFFSVQKGEKFTVKSKLGETSVLGTTFNIFSRDDSYHVLCLTGKVNVKSLTGESVILLPNQRVAIQAGKLTSPETHSQPENIISWREDRFLFSSAPFPEVISEIERQFGVNITSDQRLTGVISISFRKEPDLDKILTMVCKPLGYDFVKLSDKNYRITKSNNNK